MNRMKALLAATAMLVGAAAAGPVSAQPPVDVGPPADVGPPMAPPGQCNAVCATDLSTCVQSAASALQACLAGVDPGDEQQRLFCLDALDTSLVGCEVAAESCFTQCLP